MTACHMPTVDTVGIMEKYVNDPLFNGSRPSWKGEPFELVLPQMVNPTYLTTKQKKDQNRVFQVAVIFVAAEWFNESEQKVFLRWKYADLKVRELV